MNSVPSFSYFRLGMIVIVVLFALGFGYRQQLTVAICGEKFSQALERSSKAWWTCPMPRTWDAKKIEGVGHQDLIDAASTNDGKRIWALTRTGGIVASIDSGETWNKISEIGIHEKYKAIAASDDGASVWVTAGMSRWHSDDGSTRLFSSSDGGRSWQELDAGLENFPAQSNVRAMRWNHAMKRLFLIGERGTISYTDDRGGTWHRPYKPEDEISAGAIKRIAFTDDGQIGWAVGEHTVLTSNDGGTRWKRVKSAEDVGRETENSPPNAPSVYQRFNSVHLGQAGRDIWITADYAKLLHSRDGGQHWEISHTDPSQFSAEIHFAKNGRYGLTFDSESPEVKALFETNDTGLTWQTRSMLNGFHANKIVDVGHDLIAVGNAGTIIKFSARGSN